MSAGYVGVAEITTRPGCVEGGALAVWSDRKHRGRCCLIDFMHQKAGVDSVTFHQGFQHLPHEVIPDGSDAPHGSTEFGQVHTHASGRASGRNSNFVDDPRSLSGWDIRNGTTKNVQDMCAQRYDRA